MPSEGRTAATACSQNALYKTASHEPSGEGKHLDIDPCLARNEPPESEEDPQGLKVVYRPVGQRKADLVFVHGLGGSSRRTWSYSRNIDFFWPGKFLTREPDIAQARILTFGYNANFHPGSGKRETTILDFSKELLYDLKYSQDDSGPTTEDLRMGEVSPN